MPTDTHIHGRNRRYTGQKYKIHTTASGWVVVTHPGYCPVSPAKASKSEAIEFMKGL